MPRPPHVRTVRWNRRRGTRWPDSRRLDQYCRTVKARPPPPQQQQPARTSTCGVLALSSSPATRRGWHPRAHTGTCRLSSMPCPFATRSTPPYFYPRLDQELERGASGPDGPPARPPWPALFRLELPARPLLVVPAGGRGSVLAFSPAFATALSFPRRLGSRSSGRGRVTGGVVGPLALLALLAASFHKEPAQSHALALPFSFVSVGAMASATAPRAG